jgi:predicted ester cyclase
MATTTTTHKAIVQRLFDEVVNHNRLEVADELVAPGFIVHEGPPPGSERIVGPRAFTSMWLIKEACPDFQIRIEDILAEGDRVAVRWSGHGTHTREFRDRPPTGRRIEHRGIDIIRLDGDQLAEFWPMADILGVSRQLGLVQ